MKKENVVKPVDVAKLIRIKLARAQFEEIELLDAYNNAKSPIIKLELLDKLKLVVRKIDILTFEE